VQHDDEDQHSDRLVSTFYNDVFSLDLASSVWAPVLLGEAHKPEDMESSEEDDDEEEDGDDEEHEGVEEAQAMDEDQPEPEPEPTPEPSATMTPRGESKADGSAAAAAAVPSPRMGAGVVASPGGDSMLIFGGMRENAKGVEEPSNDVWRLTSGSGWEQLC
jgi:hypothetical protein